MPPLRLTRNPSLDRVFLRIPQPFMKRQCSVLSGHRPIVLAMVLATLSLTGFLPAKVNAEKARLPRFTNGAPETAGSVVEAPNTLVVGFESPILRTLETVPAIFSSIASELADQIGFNRRCVNDTFDLLSGKTDEASLAVLAADPPETVAIKLFLQSIHGRILGCGSSVTMRENDGTIVEADWLAIIASGYESTPSVIEARNGKRPTAEYHIRFTPNYAHKRAGKWGPWVDELPGGKFNIKLELSDQGPAKVLEVSKNYTLAVMDCDWLPTTNQASEIKALSATNNQAAVAALGKKYFAIADRLWHDTSRLDLEPFPNEAPGRLNAVYFFELAALAGNPAGLYNYGICLQDGMVYDRDPSAAISCIKKAADGGYPPAMSALGQAYAAGKVVPEDPAQAERYFAMAVDRGYNPHPRPAQPYFVFPNEIGPSRAVAPTAPPQAVTTVSPQPLPSQPQWNPAINRAARLAGKADAWVEAFARYGQPGSHFKETQEQQAAMLSDLAEVLKSGVLSEDVFKALKPGLQSLAEAGFVPATEVLALKNVRYGKLSNTDMFRPLLEAQDLGVLLPCLRAAAAKGSRDASFHLGRLAMEGKCDSGSPMQNAKSAREFLEAAWKGDQMSPECLSAAVVLSVLDYAESQVQTHDASRRNELAASARKWAQRAAQNSVPRGSFLLGRMYLEGVGGPPAPMEGQAQLLRAASEGTKVTLPPPATAAAEYGGGHYNRDGDELDC